MYSATLAKNLTSLLIFDLSSQQLSSRLKPVHCFNRSHHRDTHSFPNQFSHVPSSLIRLSEHQTLAGINSWLNGIFQHLLTESELFGPVSQRHD